MTTFHIEWGGSADLTIEEIWPDGDAPENPTTADVIAAMRKTSDLPERICRDWNLPIEDIEITGPGGFQSLARVLIDERDAWRSA